MSAPQRAGRLVEIRFIGYVTLQDVCAHVGDIWRRARQRPGILFALDCSAVIDFSTLALTALDRLRMHLREFGCDLALVRCSPMVLERKDDARLAALLRSAPELDKGEEARPLAATSRLAPEAREDGGHSPPMPHHVQIVVKVYQRYWLN